LAWLTAGDAIDEEVLPMGGFGQIARAGLIGLAAAAGIASSSALAQNAIERGEYLVNGIAACGLCHTPRNPDGTFDMSRQLSGGPQTWDRPSYKVKGSNITPDNVTGIGKWSDEGIRRAITGGVRPDEVPLAPVMPSNFYRVFTAQDLDAVVAYLRSVAPVRNEVQIPEYRAEMPVNPYPGADGPMTADDLRDPIKRGFYLASLAHCMLCHTPSVSGRPDYSGSHGKGGVVFRGPFGEARSSNITSHKTAGLGDWTDAEIARAIKHGLSRDGRRLNVMPRNYARLTDDDVDALVAWLRTIPPLD
jgi:mono/diheme cytochrome c family protein